MRNTTGAIGPGAYNIADSYESAIAVKKEFSLGTRFVDSYTFKQAASLPGPGSYKLKRFGDADTEGIATKTACATSVHRTRDGHVLQNEPGPGSYEDPTTIQSRVCRPQLTYVDDACTFGRRKLNKHDHSLFNRTPGPGSYETDHSSKYVEGNKRHAPCFRRPFFVKGAQDTSKQKSRNQIK
uniref:Outer dense fiber protein 3 n=1 Tax=Lygus hesperus TaxID=30085 RepID=A0A0A9XD24_LYGHE